jgi:hypothetical protein
MTLSSVGVLPDLRSPESIQNDIEYKEKILADILNLDKIKISLDKLQENNESCDDENDIPESQLSVSLSNAESSIPEISDDCYQQSTVKITKISSNCSPPPEQSQSGSTATSVATPGRLVNRWVNLSDNLFAACLNIPIDWKLADIQLNVKNDTSLSDNSLTDWEIV